MEEAETLCDRLAIMDHGRLIAQGTLPELRSMLGERDLLRLAGSLPRNRRPRRPRQRLRRRDPRLRRRPVAPLHGQRLHAPAPTSSPILASAGAEVRGATLTQPNLESLFIKLTGKELRE